MSGTVRLALAHLLGNALLLLLGYYWLGFADSNAGWVAASAAVLLVWMLGALWLHGSALVFFSGETRAWSVARKHLLPSLVLLCGAAIIYWLVTYVASRMNHSAFVVGSYATMHLRKPVAPTKVLSFFDLVVMVVQWVVLPALLLPLAASVFESGWHGYSWEALKQAKRPLYWVQVACLLAIAFYLPDLLMRWVPAVNGFAVQFASFALRFGVAYLLFVAGLLSLEYCTSAGRPRLAQPSTVAAP